MHDRFPIIGRAINKVIRYFAADISVTAQQSLDQTDTGALQATQKMLRQNYNLLQLVIKIGQQLAAMGNVFVYAMPVINRTLCCTNCSHTMAITNLVPKVDFQWDKGKFRGVCPKCGAAVTYKIVDKLTTDVQGRRIKFLCYSPRDIKLKYNQLTDEYTYLYQMPSHIKTAIVQGDPVYLRSTPQVFLQAAFTNDYIQFPTDKFMHLRTDTLATMDRYYKGWGTPLFLSSFNNVLRLAYLDKFNQSVAFDFIAPVRLVSPPPQSLAVGQNPMQQPISGHAVKQFIFQAIKGVRQNQSQWVVSPFPLNYQMMGGQAKQLAPVQLMKWYQDRILQDMSIPIELRQTSFQAVAQSMGLRMFQRQWIHFTKYLQYAIRWLADRVCQVHNMDRVAVSLDKTSFVQDDMNKQTVLQMAGSGMISNQTVLSTIGLQYKEEQKKKMQEEQYMAEESSKMQANMQQMEMSSSVMPPAGSQGIGAAQYNMEMVQQQNMPQDPAMAGGAGAPMPPAGPGVPAGAPGAGMGVLPAGASNSKTVVLQQLFQQAQAKAQQIFQLGRTQGAGARRSALVQLKSQNPQLHAQVKAVLQNMDQQTASQAVAQSKMPG